MAIDMFNAYITKVNDETELQNKLLEALEFVNWKNYVKSDTTVFVKPNFTYPVYDRGVTTSPVLLKKLLEILTKRGSRVILGESDGGYHAFKAEEGFEGHGAYDICKELGVELKQADEHQRPVELPGLAAGVAYKKDRALAAY